ncbi:MAG: hydroxymethylbilane synthase [Candidatus Geothermincolales bacterium]
MKVRVGTRGSPLAIRQAEMVSERLQATRPELEIQLVVIATSGDLPAGTAKPVDKGGFVKELQRALVEGQVDIAVHSLKDVPLQNPPETVLAAFCDREDPSDVMVSYKYRKLEEIPGGGNVGTASPRRTFQLSLFRPDLNAVPVRGNVGTRLEKLRRGECDALILAAAGLNRLGLRGFNRQTLPVSHFVPSPGQGIVVAEARRGDHGLIRILSRIDNPETRAEAEAEREFCLWVGADCDTRTGALARCLGDELHLLAFHWFQEEGRARRGEISGPVSKARELGKKLALFLAAGGEGGWR